MTVRSFAPWANRRNQTDPGHDRRQAIRQQMHDDIDTISDHWANIARLANEKVDLTAPREGEPGGTTSTAERNIHLERVAATAWLNELEQLRNQLLRSAGRARDIDKPAPKPSRPGEDIERCLLCTDEIGIGANGRPDARRIDGHPFHAATCYYQLYRQAERDHTTIGALAEQLDRTRQAKRNNT